jgi:thiol-disulfide isomerase/thioredoxin
VYSQGDFYYKPASGSSTTTQDSFTYTIVDKYGHKSTAKVTVNYKKTSGSTDTGTVVEVTQLDQINTALNKGPVFLKLGAEWCEYCQRMNPIMQEMATEYQGKATIMSADVDKSPTIANYFGVESMPDSCVIVSVKNGQYVYMKQNGQVTTDRSQARIIGYNSKEVFEKVINVAL